MSFERGRQHYPGEKIQVTLAERLGAGSYSCVDRINEARLNSVSFFKKQTAHARAVKTMTYSFPVALKKLVYDEYECARRTPQLHVKEPIKISAKEYRIVMRIQPGDNLTKIIKDLRAGIIKLSLSQYLNLIIALLRTVQSQVFDCNLVHRDIKPDNFMVDLSNLDAPIVNVIDYGFAKDRDLEDRRRCGSLSFMAPELKDDNSSTQQSDIFSLGISLFDLLTKDLDMQAVYDHKKSIGKMIDNGHSGEFHFRDELTAVADELKKVIKTMCHVDPAARGTLHELEEKVHEIRWNIKCQFVQEKNRIIAACKAALVVRNTLKKPKTISEIKTIIANANFADEKDAVSEFVKTLGTRTLGGCCTRGDIIAKLADIEKNYDEAYRDLFKAKTEFEMLKQKSVNKNTNHDNDINHCVIVLKRKFEKYGHDQNISIDEVVHAATRMREISRNAGRAIEALFVDKVISEDDWKQKYQAIVASLIVDKKADLETFQQEYQNSRFFSKEKLGAAITHYADLVQRKIDKYNRGNLLSCEDYINASAECYRFIEQMPNSRLEIIIKNRCERVNSRMQEQFDISPGRAPIAEVMDDLKINKSGEDKDLQWLKSIIQLGLSNYIYKTATSRNLFFHERAASKRRIGDMKNILRSVKGAKDVQSLKLEVTAHIDNIKTGLFGRSKLRDEMQHALALNADLKP